MCPNASTKEQLMLKGFIKDRYNMPVTAPSQGTCQSLSWQFANRTDVCQFVSQMLKVHVKDTSKHQWVSFQHSSGVTYITMDTITETLITYNYLLACKQDKPHSSYLLLSSRSCSVSGTLNNKGVWHVTEPTFIPDQTVLSSWYWFSMYINTHVL